MYIERGDDHEQALQAETIFPLDLDVVSSRLHVIEQSSDELYQVAVEARGKWGLATSVYANLPIEDLVAWHRDKADFGEGGDLYYKFGLLSGMDLAKHARSQNQVTDKIKITDPASLESAVEYLYETYRGLDDAPAEKWHRQKQRELYHTGSDILSIATATQYDRMQARLEAKHANPADAVALQVGMVDGAILIDALSAAQHGAQPQVFEMPTVYAPIESERHARLGHAALFDITISLENADDLLNMVKTFQSRSSDPDRFRNASPYNYGKMDITRDVMAQTGPNTFAPRAQLEKIQYRGYGHKFLGALSVAAYGVIDLPRAIIETHGPGYMPVGAAIVAASVLVSNALIKREAWKVAKKHTVTFENITNKPLDANVGERRRGLLAMFGALVHPKETLLDDRFEARS